MKTLKQIKDYVISNGFGTEMRELPDWMWSRGICYAYDDEPETWKPYIQKAMKQMSNKNYGGFYEHGEKPVEGSEYFLCESPFGHTIGTGIILHREPDKITMYFQFER